MCALVKVNDKENTLKIREGKEGKEYVVTRHYQFKVPINILNIYGEQECRTRHEEIKQIWDDIFKIIKNIEDKGDIF